MKTKFKIGETATGFHIVNFPKCVNYAGISFSKRKEFVVQGFKNIPWQPGPDGYYILDIHENRYPARLCNGLDIEDVDTLEGDVQLKAIFE